MVRFIQGTLFFLLLFQMGIFFLISVSDISLLVYKNAFNFWILIFYLAIFPNSLIRSSSFLLESIGFCMYTMSSSANHNSFTSSFPIWMPFISFFFVWSLWLELPLLCWIEIVKADILLLFLILGWQLLGFVHWVWCWLQVSHIWKKIPFNIISHSTGFVMMNSFSFFSCLGSSSSVLRF